MLLKLQLRQCPLSKEARSYTPPESSASIHCASIYSASIHSSIGNDVATTLLFFTFVSAAYKLSRIGTPEVVYRGLSGRAIAAADFARGAFVEVRVAKLKASYTSSVRPNTLVA